MHTQKSNGAEQMDAEVEVQSPEKKPSPVKEAVKSGSIAERREFKLRNQDQSRESKHSVSPSPFKIPRASGKQSTAKGMRGNQRELTIFGEGPQALANDKSVTQFSTSDNANVNLVEFKGKGRGKSGWNVVRTTDADNRIETFGQASRLGSWETLEINDQIDLIKVRKTVENVCEIQFCNVRQENACLSSAVNDVDSTDAETYEYTIYEGERIVGVYGSLDNTEKHVTSLGFIIQKQ